MKDIEVIKRDGSREKLDYEKIHKVLLWAVDNITGVSASEVELKAHLNLYDGITTTEIHDTLIGAARDLISEDTPNYDRVAGRLEIFNIRKEVYGSYDPCPFIDIVKKNVELGYYDPTMIEEFTDEEINELGEYIVHDRDYNFRYAATQQLVSKYLAQNRTTSQIFESPQVAYMLIAMTMFMYDYDGNDIVKSHYTKKQRLKIIKEFYDDVSLFKTGLPTPILAGARTPTRQYSSCVVIETDDNLDSLSHTNVAIMRYISKKAGLGLNLGRVRPEGSSIRNGEIKHTGLVPFIKAARGAVKSCSQGGLRGGSATMHFPIWHTDIENLIVLKNNKGTEETRERHLDYSVGISGLFLERLVKNKDITLLPPNLDGLYDSFYEDPKKFKELYEHYEKSDEVPSKLKKKISASKLFGKILTEGKNTGRIYIHVVDEMNRHTPFDREHDPIHQSNLCVSGDTKILTDKGDVEIQSIVGKVANIWNGTEWSEVTPMQTGIDQELYTVTVEKTVNGIMSMVELKATPYHKWYDQDGIELRTNELYDNLELLRWKQPDGSEVHSKVLSVTVASNGDTYCVTEPKANKVVFNGILVGNCQEIALPTRPFYGTDDESGRIALCTLANTNLGEFSSPQTMKHPLRRIIRGLDNILSMQEYPMIQAKLSTEEFRPLGIGVNNLAYFLAKNNVSYSDPNALPLVHQWMEHMAYYMQEATIDLAKERGACTRSQFTKRSKGIMLVDTYKKKVDELVSNNLELDWGKLSEDAKVYGVRNATLSATMPSESNSQLMNCMSFDTVIRTSLGDLTFKEFAESQGLDYDDILETGGDIWFDVDEGITVKNMNGDQESVTGLYYNGNVVVDEIELEDGTILHCTPQHRFLVNRNGNKEWVFVKDLVEGDDIVEVEGG